MSIIVNSRISFVFALMKCSFAAFGEQNKIDNDSKCQQVYKSLCFYVAFLLQLHHVKIHQFSMFIFLFFG